MSIGETVRGQDSSGVELAGGISYWGLENEIKIVDSMAFLATSNGLSIIDIANPFNPQEKSFIERPNNIWDFEIQGDYLYIANCSSGLRIYNISESDDPVEIGGYEDGIWYQEVEIAETLAYMPFYDSLLVLDISDPSDLQVEGRWLTGRNFSKIKLREPYLFALDYTFVYPNGSYGYLSIFDISDPGNISLVSETLLHQGPKAIKLQGNYAFIISENETYSFDISDPQQPIMLDIIDFIGGEDISINDDLMYLVDGWDDFIVLDISEPANLSALSNCFIQGHGYGAAADSNYVYIAARHYENGNMTGGLRIYDVTSPVNPVEISYLNKPYGSYSVYIQGDRAYEAVIYRGLRIIDISNPAEPSILGQYFDLDYITDVEVIGDLAYTATDYFQIFNVADPANIYLVGQSAYGIHPREVEIRDTLAYLANDTDGLWIMSISDPANPTLIGSCDTPGTALAVALTGNYAIIADHNYRIRIIDVSNPASPQEIGYFMGASSMNAWDVEAEGNYVYVAFTNHGFTVLDISDPTNPVEIANIAYPINPQRLHLYDNKAYVTSEDEGLFIFDVSAPSNPVLIGYNECDNYFSGIYAQGEYAYIAAHNHFFVYDCSEALGVKNIDITEIPSAFSLTNIYPNPFNHQTEIGFTIREAGKIKLSVYDVLGREVTKLKGEFLPAGTYNVNWNAENLGSGIYFVELSQGQQKTVKKAVMIK